MNIKNILLYSLAVIALILIIVGAAIQNAYVLVPGIFLLFTSIGILIAMSFKK